MRVTHNSYSSGRVSHIFAQVLGVPVPMSQAGSTSKVGLTLKAHILSWAVFIGNDPCCLIDTQRAEYGVVPLCYNSRLPAKTSCTQIAPILMASDSFPTGLGWLTSSGLADSSKCKLYGGIFSHRCVPDSSESREWTSEGLQGHKRGEMGKGKQWWLEGAWGAGR